ncbi:MAG: potassium transporter TrkH [Pseudooceanicola sp.]|jgi:trk system potassium uptake protein TrkH|nr:potassium transporter TrkH [Pseudooceanicola sp.]
MVRAAQPNVLMRMPLFLLIWGIAAASMFVPASHALVLNNHPASRSFFYAGLLGLIAVTLIALAMGTRPARNGPVAQLLSLLGTFAVLPVFLAIPFHDALGTTSFLNAYMEMVSAITTTGAPVFEDPGRLIASLHLWRAQVGWMGGLLMWIAASAVLAPLSLGGFEITARGEPGRGTVVAGMERADPRRRLARVTLALAPIYAGLTVAVWVLLLIAGEGALAALCHAMSVMATSGISPLGGLDEAQAGMTGELILFLFMFFALSRLTFSGDTVVRGFGRLDRDPEFRLGILIVLALPLLLFVRHWWGALDIASAENVAQALHALWGAMFTVMSFLTTTGFESADWAEARQWSGLDTPGLILLGLATFGGGVATTAGGVKLLRVYTLYLNGLDELHRLVHPHSVSVGSAMHQRVQRNGAFIAWISFMLFALSLATVWALLSAMHVPFSDALVLTIAALSTTGPLIGSAADTPIHILNLSVGAKSVLCAAMVIGRLETLAIVALLTPDLWRS